MPFHLLNHYLSDEPSKDFASTYHHYVTHLREHSGFDDATLDFLERQTIHDAYLGQLEIDFYASTLILYLDFSDNDGSSYRFCYSGVDFSKSVLVLEDNLQFLVDEIELEKRYKKQDFLLSSPKSGSHRMTLVFDDLRIVKANL